MSFLDVRDSLEFAFCEFTHPAFSFLTQNDEFHQILEEQTRWLISTEENIQSTEPVDVTEDMSVIEAKYLKFRVSADGDASHNL